MTLVIVATVGDSTANSFVTLVEAQAYVDARLNVTLWDAASTDTQNRALVEATRELHPLQWIGSPVTTTQALAWPRAWAENPDSPYAGSNVFYASDVIPQRVKDATCELAIQFVKAGTTDVAALPANDGVIEKQIDVIVTRWADPWAQKTGLARYPRVMALLRPLLCGTGINMRVSRG